MLRPFTNALAVSGTADWLSSRLAPAARESDRFDRVWQPNSSWLVASQDLPGSPAASPEELDAGIVVLEGRDRLEELGPNWLDQLASICDTGPTKLRRLPGDFSFLRFLPDGEIVSVRSCGGLVPLYSRGERDRFAISTRLADLVGLFPTGDRLDPLSCAIWLSGWTMSPDQRYLIEHVRIQPRGSFRRRRGPAQPYWDPRPASESELRDDESLADDFRRVLLQSLERDLPDDQPSLLTLSGGVDSSSLGVLACDVLGRELWSLSFVSRDPSVRKVDDHFIELVAGQRAFPRRWMYFLDHDARARYVKTAPQDIVGFPLHPALGVMGELEPSDRPPVLIGGEYADEVAGSRFTFPDWAEHASMGDLLGRAGWPSGRFDLARALRRRWKRRIGRDDLPVPAVLPPVFTASVREEYEEWHGRQLVAYRADPRPLRTLAARGLYDGFLQMNWEALSALGMRRSVPFHSREMLELAFSAHPRRLVGPGSKRLLRDALGELVEPEILARAGRSQWHESPGAVRSGRPAEFVDDRDALAPGFDRVFGPPSGRRDLSGLDFVRLTWAAEFSHRLRRAGWFTESPTPGELGAAS